MIKRFLAWLKSIYIHPAEPAEFQPKENIVKLILASIITSMLANGAAANTVQVTLTDDTGAILPGAVVSFSANNGATVNPSSALTDANGQITVSLVSSTAGASTLTATASDGTADSIDVYFVAVPQPVTSVVNTAPAAEQVVLSPLEALKAEAEKFFAFVEHGIEVLGEEAEAELVALKKKYL